MCRSYLENRGLLLSNLLIFLDVNRRQPFFSVKAAITQNEEFTYEKAEHFVWTDRKVVLGYIANETKRFHLFVANRVGFIHSSSDQGPMKLRSWFAKCGGYCFKRKLSKIT